MRFSLSAKKRPEHINTVSGSSSPDKTAHGKVGSSPGCVCIGWGPSGPADLRLRVAGGRLRGRVEHTHRLPWQGSASQVTPAVTAVSLRQCWSSPCRPAQSPYHLCLPTTGKTALLPGLPSDLSQCPPTSQKPACLLQEALLITGTTPRSVSAWQFPP